MAADGDGTANGVLSVGYMGTDVGKDLGVVTNSFGNHEVAVEEKQLAVFYY